MRDSETWRLRLLGDCALSGPDGAPVALSTRKALALLAYLAAQPERRASRERLAALFWEDANSGQARLNLRKALSTLRQETRPANRPDLVLLEASNDAVWLTPGALATDVEAFEAALKASAHDPAAASPVAELYAGDFLGDFAVRGAPAFEAWALVERQRLRELALAALSDLMERALEPGFSPEVGVRAAMRVLALDPLQERAHRALMRLHVRQGRHAAALKQFHALSEQLARELNTTPEAATRELFREISSARHTGAPARVALAASDRGEAETPPVEPAGARPRRRRTPLLVAAAAACLGLAAIGGVAVFWPQLLSGVLPAPARQKSVAVLPFANFSGQAEDGLFADGLTEEVINSLAQYADLKVSGRTSAFYFKGKNEDLREVGRKLGVAYVIEGSVRREGDRLRVTAQLINVADGFHLWSATYDKRMSDAFAVQDEVARAVAGELKARLEGPRHHAVQVTPEAYQLYLVAQAHLRNGGKDDLATARRLFERQLAITPEDPRALAGYAKATIGLADQFALPIEEARGPAEAAVARALRADPNSADAYAARSKILVSLSHWTGEQSYEDKALQAAKRAVELAPRDPDALIMYGHQLIYMDRPDEAVTVLEQAVQVDPLTRIAQVLLAAAYRASGRFEEAARQYQTTVDLFPEEENARLSLGRLLYEQDRVVEAERSLKAAYAVTDGGPKGAYYQSYLYYNLQMPDEGAAALALIRKPAIIAKVARTLALHQARDYRGALAFAEAEVARDPDSLLRANVYKDAAILGDYAKARRELQTLAPELLSASPEIVISSLDVAIIAPHVLNRTGEQAQARRILERMLALTAPRPGRQTSAGRWLARISAFAELGDKERALTEMRRAVDAGFHEHVEFDNFVYFEDWPSIRLLRGDPRFARMLGEIEAHNRRLRDDLLAARRKAARA